MCIYEGKKANKEMTGYRFCLERAATHRRCSAMLIFCKRMQQAPTTTTNNTVQESLRNAYLAYKPYQTYCAMLRADAKEKGGPLSELKLLQCLVAIDKDHTWEQIISGDCWQSIPVKAILKAYAEENRDVLQAAHDMYALCKVKSQAVLERLRVDMKDVATLFVKFHIQ
jgi:hypothetical protein